MLRQILSSMKPQDKHMRIINGVLRRIKLVHRKFVVWKSFKVIHGLKGLEIKKDEATVVCMIRDGEFFIKKFIEHYQKMGVRHIVFVDNGSIDKTVEIAKKYDFISILECKLPVKSFESDMRHYAGKIFSKGGWCLFADVDEHMEYFGQDNVSLSKLLEYLNFNLYTAVIGQMCDLYPKDDIALDYFKNKSADFTQSHRYFEIDTLSLMDYHDSNNVHSYFLRENTIPSTAIKFTYGGVRRRIFGSENWLTKHPLVRFTPPAMPSTHPACSSRVRCADFVVVLKHYKFAGDFHGRVKREISNKSWGHGDNEIYFQKLKNDSPKMYSEKYSMEYISVEKIPDQNYIYVSKKFRDWCRSV